MKVLYWTPKFWPSVGGIEVLAMKAIPELEERNYEFTVVTTAVSREKSTLDNYQGIPIHHFPMKTALAKRDLKGIATLKREVSDLKARFQPDLVHINYSLSPMVFFHLETQNAWPAPFLVTMHCQLDGIPLNSHSLIRKLFQTADWVSGVSKATLSEAIHWVPALRDRSSVIYNGVRKESPAVSPLPFRPPVLLCLGRFIHLKGFDIAIKAFAILRRSILNVRLIIAGDGPARAECEQLVADLGLTSAVDFAGWRSPDDIPALINTATLVVIPSRRTEPFPLVALEAAQMGRPVVASNVGGLPEIVLHGQSGLLVNDESERSFANAIESLLNSPRMATAMGKYARINVMERFPWRKCIDEYDSLYKKLTQNKTVIAV